MTEIRNNFLTVKIMLKNITNLHNGTKKNPNPFLDFSKKINEIFKVKPPKSTGLKFGAKYLNNFFVFY